MHAPPRPHTLPLGATLAPYATPRPRPPVPPPAPEDAGALFDTALLRELLAFALHALRRRRRAALVTFVAVLATAVAALALMPRSYYTETKLLAQRNVVIPMLGNPGRKLPNESDTPTRLASEAIMNRSNLEAIVNATDLVAHWRAHRAPIAQAKDWVTARIMGPPTRQAQVDALVWLLNKSLWVNIGEGTVTIGITWPDPNMAYRIVQAAQENFLEERHTEELALISESIGILEEHAATVNGDIKASLDSMARVRASVAPADPSPLMRVLRRAAPSSEAVAAQARLETVRRTVADLEQFRNRRLAEMQATLADQRNVYGPEHPQIANTQQLIRSLLVDSPQLVQLRREEQELRAKLAQLGADAGTPTASTSADPLLATAAIRSLDRLRSDSLVGEKQQYSRARLRISIRSFEELLERIDAARIELQTTRAAFKYRYGVLMPPQIPTGPVKPRPALLLGGGLVLAMMLALFVAVGLDTASGRILERWQIERALGLPVLGEVPRA